MPARLFHLIDKRRNQSAADVVNFNRCQTLPRHDLDNANRRVERIGVIGVQVELLWYDAFFRKYVFQGVRCKLDVAEIPGIDQTAVHGGNPPQHVHRGKGNPIHE